MRAAGGNLVGIADPLDSESGERQTARDQAILGFDGAEKALSQLDLVVSTLKAELPLPVDLSSASFDLIERSHKAADSYRQSLDRGASGPRYFGLGRALLALGRRDEAREAYQAGREMASADEIEEALKALQGVDEEVVSWLCD